MFFGEDDNDNSNFELKPLLKDSFSHENDKNNINNHPDTSNNSNNNNNDKNGNNDSYGEKKHAGKQLQQQQGSCGQIFANIRKSNLLLIFAIFVSMVLDNFLLTIILPIVPQYLTKLDHSATLHHRVWVCFY